MTKREMAFIWTHYSIRRYLRQAEIGVPLIFLQQGHEKEPYNTQTANGSIQFIISGPDFIQKGSRAEMYADVKIDCMIQTRMLETDIYYHQRIKARCVDKMIATIPIYKGGSSETGFNKDEKAGYLRPIPTSSIEVAPVSVIEPFASTITQVYELEIC